MTSARRRAIPVAAALSLLFVAVGWIGSSYVERRDRGLAEDRLIYRAFAFARAAARLTEAGRGAPTPHLVEFGNAAGAAAAEANPEGNAEGNANAADLLRLLVIDLGQLDEFGVRTGASVIWSMHGHTGPIPDMDRPLADRASHIAAKFGSGQQKRPLHLYELVEFNVDEPGWLRIAAYAPVVVNSEARGLAGALLRAPAREAPTPLAPWMVTLGFVALAWVGCWFVPGRPRWVAAGLVSGWAVAVALGSPGYLAESTRAHLEQRAQDLLAVQSYADTYEPVTLVSPIAGRERWSAEGALRLEREPGSAAPDALRTGTTRVGGPTASVHLHPDYEDDVAGVLRLDVATWAVIVAALLLLAVGPVSRLLHGIWTQPGTYAYTAPAIVGLLVLVIIPFLTGVGLSFYRYHLEGNAYQFVGLGNFAEIIAPQETSDINFWWTLIVTLLWTSSNVVLHVSIGLALALVLNRPNLRGKKIYRTLLILPWAIPNYITALMWRSMFIGESGPINSLLGTLGIGPISWFDDNFWTNFTPNLVANTWLGFPFMMVVSLGALQSIPTGLYEAAELDGASKWQQFRNVTLPLLKPALLPAVILGTIWTFNMFNIIYLVSMGAGGTEILITDAYRAFHEQHRHGFAAAYSVLIFFILLSYTFITNRVSRAAEGALE